MAHDEGTGPAAESDPRLDGQHVRTVGTDGAAPVHLVGVVHDHPASAYRARATVESVDPDVVALEVAPVALPFFADADDAERVAFGDEFRAAAAAASEARVVGIDAPNARFLAALARRCVADGVSASTARRLLRGTASVTREALACRLAATVSARTSFDVDVGERVDHDCDPTDDPATQAADEASQVAGVETVLSALERPASVRVRDEVREACMARKLHALRREGPVVAVVGRGHLEALVEELDERAATTPLADAGSGADGSAVRGLLRAVGRRASDA